MLDIDPENAQAYLGKLMAELKVRRRDELKNCAEPFDGSGNYQRAFRFGDASLKEQLDGYITFINKRNENDRKTGIYNDAVKVMTSAHTEAVFKGAAEKFRTIPGFKDADALAEECLEKAEISRKDAIYDSARQEMIMDKIAGYESAIAAFRTISGWRDAEEQIALCQKRIGEIKAQEETDRLEMQRQAEEKRIADEIAAKKRKKVISIAAPIVCVCIAFVILLTQVIVPKQKLNKAMSMIDSGDYDAAYAMLEELGNNDAIAASKYDRAMERIDAQDYETALALLDGIEYKDSEEKRESIKPIYYRELFADAAVGDTIFFGAYEQDNDTSDGKENIEWLVLAKEDDRLLVISQYALDCRQYNTEYDFVTWESCTLREWLNADFFNAAFSDGEKAMIPTVTVSADKNPDYSTNPGSATEDKVFLLSITEANKYFKTAEERMCVPTSYAKAHGAYTSSDYTKGGAATCWWWLRSPGKYQEHAASVDYDGGVVSYGNTANFDRGCVRPAMWIDLSV